MKSNKKTTNKSKMVTKTKSNKRTLPTNVSYNTAGTYRVRKVINGKSFDTTFTKLKYAKTYLKMLNSK